MLAIEEAVRQGKDVATLNDASWYFERLHFHLDRAERRTGYPPTGKVAREELENDPLLRGLSDLGFAALVNSCMRQLVTEGFPVRVSQVHRVARRRMNLALRFLPSRQRERYRSEWEGEMAGMEPAAVGQFALHLVIRAPLAGMLFRLHLLLGRQAA
ncbi:hypothetical protein [Streptomyces californicus]|uniref:hypothetical protein n=1 Tax=Streptomyces californicus TaxID=67351 RepID=UPI00381858B0